MEPVNSIELIYGTTPQSWSLHNLSASVGQWSKDSVKGSILQTGNLVDTWGSILTLNQTGNELDTIGAHLKYVSEGQVGIVFKFADKDNFVLLLFKGIDDRNCKACLVTKTSGTYTTELEKDISIAQPEFLVVIAQLSNGVSFQLGDKEIFTWNNTTGIAGQIGLYCNQTSRAEFYNVSVGMLKDMSKDVTQETIEVQDTLQNNERVVDKVKNLADYLNIGSPRSETQVEFNEIFTVPLDAFYVSLYRNYGEKKLRPDIQPPTAKPEPLTIEGSRLFTYNLSAEKLIVLAAKGWNRNDQYDLPIQSVYSAIIDKTSMSPLEEYEVPCGQQRVSGILPTGAINLEFQYRHETVFHDLQTGEKKIVKPLTYLCHSPSGSCWIGADHFTNTLVAVTENGVEVNTFSINEKLYVSTVNLHMCFVAPDDKIVVGWFIRKRPKSNCLVFWSAVTGLVLKELIINEEAGTYIEFSKDSANILVWCGKYRALLDGRSLLIKQIFPEHLTSAFFTADGQFVVGYWHQNALEFYHADSGAFYFTAPGVTSAHPLDGSNVIRSYGDKLEIINVATQDRQVIPLQTSFTNFQILACDVHPTTNEFFVHVANRFYFFDSETKTPTWDIEGYVENGVYNKDGRFIVPKRTINFGSLTYLHVELKRLVNVRVQVGSFLSSQQNNDGTMAILNVNDSMAYVYDFESSSIKLEWPIKPTSSINLSSTGGEIIEDINIVDLTWKDVESKQTFTLANNLASWFDAASYSLPLEISPDGNLLLLYNKDTIPTLWDARSKKVKHLLDLESCQQAHGFIFSPDSERLLGISNRRRVTELSLKSDSVQECPDMSGEGSSVGAMACCYHPSGLSFYTFHDDGLVRNWKSKGSLTCETLNILFSGHYYAQYMGCSPRADRMFLFNSIDGIIVLINLVTNKEEQIIEIGQGTYPTLRPAISFSPDGNSLIIPNGKGLTMHDLDPLKIPQQDHVPSTFSYLLDYRPKRWYRTLKSAQDQESYYGILAKKFGETIRALQTSIFSPVPQVTGENEMIASQFNKINDGLKEITAYQNKYQETIRLTDKALDVQQAISGELRVNGYNLVFRDSENPSSLYTLVNGRKKYFSGQLEIEEELTNKGYNFAIIGGKPKVKRFAPFEIDPAFDYTDNDAWRTFFGEFKASLLNQDTLSQEKKQKFQQQADQLHSLASNKKLQSQLETIQREVAAAKDAGLKLDQQIRIVEDEIALWAADQKLLNSVNLSSYNSFYTYFNYEKGKFKKLGTQLSVASSSWGDSVVRTYKVHLFLWMYSTITETHARANYQYTVSFQSANKSRAGFTSTRHLGEGAYEAYDYLSGEPPHGFVHRLRSECSYMLSDLMESLKRLQSDGNKIDNEILFHNTALEDIVENSLAEERKRFVSYWNDANQFGAIDIIENQIIPEADPLSDLLVSLQYGDTDVVSTGPSTPIPLQQLKWKTDYFKFAGDQFYNEEGLTLHAYLEFLKGSKSQRVAIFPKMEDDGTINSDAYIAVVNPQPSLTMDEDLPVIKFVESYRISIRWTGYSLGELSHTENLFPGETKEIKITRTLKLTRKQEQSQSVSESKIQKTSSSFEENLQKEISLKKTSTVESEESMKTESKASSAIESEDSNTETKDLNLDVKFPDFIPGVNGGLDAKTRKESTNRNAKKETLENSLTQNTRVANKEAHEAFSKDNLNTIRKAASETSQENKMELKVSSSEEYASSQETGELIKLENPNIGRTINYYFFQIQNGYEVRTILTDVKIVVDMNREVIKGSTVTDVRVFDLEEVGKIFADESEDARYLLTTAIIARQVFKNYLTGISGIGRGNGALGVKENFLLNRDMLDVVNFTKRLTKTQAKPENLLTDLYEALSYLKQVPFEFREVPINLPKEYFINAGGYYLDSEVGKKPAIENYLEDRRDIETSLKQSEVDMLKAKIEAKAFYPPAASINSQASQNVDDPILSTHGS